MKLKRLSVAHAAVLLWISQLAPRDALAAEAARAPLTAPSSSSTLEPKLVAEAERADEEPLETDGLAAALSVLPGVLVHGTGHYVAGHTQTGNRLLLMEGIGLGMVLLGGTSLVLTGAARDLVGPSAGLIIGGVGLFGVSFFADIYGVSVPEAWRGASPRQVYGKSQLGVAYVHDPQFDYRWFTTAGFERWVGPFRVAPTGWFSLGAVNERLRLEVGHRFFGPRPNSPAEDGSHIDLDFGVTQHDFGAEGFSSTTIEGQVATRLDLKRIGPSLRGSFAEMDVGWAITRTGYEVRSPAGEKAPPDYHELLLYRFGFGAYLPQNSGEVSLYYDHRHDDYAAGLIMQGLGSGVAGHFGARGEYYFPDWLGISGGERPLGLALDAQIGSARLLNLSLVYREAQP